jgi:4-amino-4-deoxy-L-arabinose transferase-like glycosyltransferase
MGPDEPRYSQVAREMFERRDFITPTLGGLPWFEKPALLYWLQGLGYSLFGVNEFAARLPSMLAALFSIWMVFHTVRRFAGDEPALLAASAMASSLFFIGFAHAATFDMLLTACVTACLCCFLLFERQQHKKWLWLAYAAAGAGVLAKGFVAPIVIGLAMLSYLVVSGRIKRIAEYRPVAGTTVALAVAAIWLLPVTMIHGYRFWDDFFVQHHLMRFTTSRFHRSGGPLFYVSILLLGSYPWTPALFLKSDSLASARPLKQMAWCWFVSTFLFFSFSQSKLPGYILPLMPAFAMIAALSLHRSPQHPRRATVLFLALHSLMVAALILSASSFPLPRIPILAFAVITGILASAGLLAFNRKQWRAALIANAAIPVLALLIALGAVYPHTNWDETRNLAAAVRPELVGGKKLLLYHVYDFPMVFYTNARVELTSTGYFPEMRNDQDLFRHMGRHGDTHIVVNNEELEWMRRENLLNIISIIQGPQHSIVLASRR